MQNGELEGYFSEVFSSFQGEGGTVRGSCFGKRQIFIRFSGCNLAEGDFDSNGCFWCDSRFAAKSQADVLKYQEVPRNKMLNSIKNPITVSRMIEILKKLITPDLHSISFTGGEPLLQFDLLLSLAKTLKIQSIKYHLMIC